MLSLAAYERARRALREACELHSRGARVESNRTHRSKREGQPQGLSFSFWSKCGDSNSRPPVPEAINDSFLTTFVRFLVLLSPKTVLSGTLVHTVSTQSKSVDGQRCGHRAISDSLKARKLNRVYRVLSFYCDLSIAYFSQIVNNLS